MFKPLLPSQARGYIHKPRPMTQRSDCKPLVNLGCSIDSIDRWRQPGCYGSGYSGVLTPMQYLGVLTPMQ